MSSWVPESETILITIASAAETTKKALHMAYLSARPTDLKSLFRKAGTFTTSPFSSKLTPALDTSFPPCLALASGEREGSSILGDIESLLGPAMALMLVVII